MIFFFSMLGWLSLAFAEGATTHLPAGLYKQLPSIVDRPLAGNPVTILNQFLPEGKYPVRLEDGRTETLVVRNNVLCLKVGKAFELRCHYPIYQPSGGVIFGSGRTLISRVTDGWTLTHDFHHRAPLPEPERARRQDVPLFLKFTLYIDAKHDLRALTWDTADMDGKRRRGSLRFIRRRPPPSRRCDLLTVLPFPD